MKSKITLEIDFDLVREAKVLAARRGISVSHLLAEHLEELIRRDKTYEASKRRALQHIEKGLDLRWTPVEDRSELHER